jgi:heat shock protein HslJ
MQPITRTKKLPLLPVLAGAMILIPFLLFTGCTGQVPGPRLEGTGWTLTGYMHNGTVVPPIPGTTITLDFGTEGKISGSAGCNHYFASFEVKDTGITIGQAGSTEMYCSTPGVMDQESTFFTLLVRSKTISVEGEHLTLYGEQGAPILTFAKTVFPKQQPLVGTNWTLESIHTGDAVSSVLAGTTITAVFNKDGRITGSAGCNQYFASYNVTGTSLMVSQAGSTKMACGAPGVMQQESSYLTLISQAKTFAIKGDRLTLADTKGTAMVSFLASDQPPDPGIK